MVSGGADVAPFLVRMSTEQGDQYLSDVVALIEVIWPAVPGTVRSSCFAAVGGGGRGGVWLLS